MTPQQATALVTRLLRGFPYLNAHDPEGYMAALADTLSRYPHWAGQHAILAVAREKPEFLPTEQQLRKCLDDDVRVIRTGIEWEQSASRQLEERALLQAAATPKQGYEDFKAEMAARGMPVEKGGMAGETPASVRQKLDLTQAQWDALENAPPAGHWVRLQAQHQG